MKLLRMALVITILCSVNVSLSAKNLKEKKQKIANDLAEIALMGGDRIGYSQEILHHLANVDNIYPQNRVKDRRYRSRYRRRRRDTIDPYSLLSGGLAIRESLQLDSIRPGNYSGKDVKVSTLQGPEIKSHPFKKMLANRKYKTFELAQYCPENFYYFHFNNMSGALNFFDYLSSVGGSVYKKFTPHSTDYLLKEKILRQLALRENKAARKFYNYVIKEMVVVGSDPFIMEGTDISVIYKLQVPTVFKLTINKHRDYYKKRYKARKKNFKIGKYRTELLYSKDKKIHSYLTKINEETIIISNSRKAVEKIIKVISKKQRALADADDFKYMRSIYPADKDKEDGFLYLSDSFIRYLVSPELRIKEARRMNEAMRISVLEKYILYYYQLKGKKPGSLKQIAEILKAPPLTKIQKKVISDIKKHKLYKIARRATGYSATSWYGFKRYINTELKKQNPKGKNLYNEAKVFANFLTAQYQKVKKTYPNNPKDIFDFIDRKNGKNYNKLFKGLSVSKKHFFAKSRLFGKQGYFKGNLETRMEYISQREADEYIKFKRNYTRYWRDFFDPIGIRIKLDNGIKVDTCILPLINNSVYDALTSFIGGAPVSLSPNKNIDGEIFSATFKLNKNSIRQNRNASKAENALNKEAGLRGISLLDLIHDEFQIHLLDTRPLVDFDGKKIISEMLRSNSIQRSEVFAGFLAWSLFHPVRASLPLKDAAGAEKVLLALDRYMAGKPKNLERYFSFNNYSYEYKGKSVRVLKLSFFHTLTFRIYYTISNNALEVTSTKHYIESLIDNKKSTVAKGFSKSTGNIIAVYRPKQMNLERDMYILSMLESAQESSFKNFGTIKLLKRMFPKSNNLPDKSLEVFGFKPVCPMGGRYFINKKTGAVQNTAFGSLSKPVIDKTKIKSGEIQRYFSTEEIKVELEFTPEGIKTRIITR